MTIAVALNLIGPLKCHFVVFIRFSHRHLPEEENKKKICLKIASVRHFIRLLCIDCPMIFHVHVRNPFDFVFLCANMKTQIETHKKRMSKKQTHTKLLVKLVTEKFLRAI